MTQRTSSTVYLPLRSLPSKDETSTDSPKTSPREARAHWMHAQADRFSAAQRRGRLFFAVALLTMLMAIGFATSSSTHVLERATLAQQVEAAPAVEEPMAPLRVNLEHVQ